MENCYKLHGSSLGYKPKQKSSTVAVNQVSNIPPSEDKQNALNNYSFNNFSIEQCHQLMTMLPNYLISAEVDEHKDNSSTSCIAGTCLLVLSKNDINFMKFWILDSGASQNICSNINVFASIRHVRNITVTLPNGIHFRRC